MEDKGSKPLLPEFSNGYMRDISNFVDENIQAVRAATVGLAAIGIVVIGRSIYVLQRFTNVQEIPRRLIDKNVSLQGKLKKVGVNGTLYVEHIPIMAIRSRPNPDLLPVRLGALGSLQGPALSYLEKSMKNRHVWFQMLAVNQSKELESVVYYQGPFFNRVYANDYLVKKGLASVEPLEKPPNTNIYNKYIERLIELEVEAQKKERGMWAGPPLIERVKTRSRQYVDDQVNCVKTGIDNRVQAVKGNINSRINVVKSNVNDKVVAVKENVKQKVTAVTTPVKKTYNVVSENVIAVARAVQSVYNSVYGGVMAVSNGVKAGVATVQNGVNSVKKGYQAVRSKLPKGQKG